MLAQNRLIAVYPLQHFMQWGIPEDVAEYNYWSRAFRRLTSQNEVVSDENESVIIPMAGMGQRFIYEGFALPKPLLPVSGKSMVAQASHDLPPARKRVFIMRRDMPGLENVITELSQLYPDSVIRTVERVTEGQACTAMIGIDALEQATAEVTGPITIGTCDSGVLYDHKTYRKIVRNTDTDVIVWG